MHPISFNVLEIYLQFIAILHVWNQIKTCVYVYSVKVQAMEYGNKNSDILKSCLASMHHYKLVEKR